MTQARALPAVAAPTPVVHPTPARVPQEVIKGYQELADLVSTVSDVLDEFGIRAAVPASELAPRLPGSKICGSALTVLNVPRREQPHGSGSDQAPPSVGAVNARDYLQPGDIRVVQSVPGISAMGAISARGGRSKGELGAIVDGGIRDAQALRVMGYPVWSRDVSPITLRGRIQTTVVNGPVVIGGVLVMPGDLVCADDDGICFVPAALAAPVLKRCKEIAAAESASLR